MQRREFLAAAATVGTVAAASTFQQVHAQGVAAVPGDQRAKAKLRFSSNLGIIPGGNDDEKLKWMKENGFDAVEIGSLGRNYADWKRRADDAGLEISALCIGEFGRKLVDEDEDKRKQGYDEVKAQLERAGAVGAAGIVFVPAFGAPDRPYHRLRELTVTMLKDLGPFAAEHNTHIILEPLRRNEAWFLRQVSDGAAIARDAGVPGVGVMGDTYHMYLEEANDMAAFIAGGEFLKHVHIGSGRGRVLPNEQNHSAKGHTHTEGFRGLKYIGYTGVVSFECGVGGSNDKAVEVPKCLDYLRKCWEEA
jgi:sugar phosphate isomerase/epimerase